jgi:hypothetical protein
MTSPSRSSSAESSGAEALAGIELPRVSAAMLVARSKAQADNPNLTRTQIPRPGYRDPAIRDRRVRGPVGFPSTLSHHAKSEVS